MKRKAKDEKDAEGDAAEPSPLPGRAGALASVAAAAVIPAPCPAAAPSPHHPRPPRPKERAPVGIRHRPATLRRLQEVHGRLPGRRTHLPKDHEWIKVFEIDGRSGHEHFMPRPCMQCENAPCLKVCPVGRDLQGRARASSWSTRTAASAAACAWPPAPTRRATSTTRPAAAAEPVRQPDARVPGAAAEGHRRQVHVLRAPHARTASFPPASRPARWTRSTSATWRGTSRRTRARHVQLSKYLRDNDAFRYKEELNTSPRVWYVAGHGQDLESGSY